ncbi:MAG: hypothetical protein PHV11_07425 [Candidatus Bipolaricaulis sp.]|nr:hypothetical protein [Candidatus Bipolaricaulis sp.]
MNRVEILRKVLSLVDKGAFQRSVREELTPALRKFRPKSFERLRGIFPMEEEDMIRGVRGSWNPLTEGASNITLRPVEPGLGEGGNASTKTVLHELWHEKQARNPEFKKDIKEGEVSKVFEQDKPGLSYPDYTGIRTSMHNPAEMSAETLARHMLAPETLSRLPEAVRKKVPQWFEKYRSVIAPVAGVGAASAISFVDPSESQAAIGMETAKGISKAAKSSLVKNWEPDIDVMKLLKGSIFKNKVIASVYRPPSLKEKVEAITKEMEEYSPSHSLYKKLNEQKKSLEAAYEKDYMGGEKRVITFEDNSYITMDKDDLKTIITRKGLENYMEGTEVIKGYEASLPSEKGKMALRSVQMRNWYKDSYNSIEEAREFRKKNARHQMDLFGEMLTPVETIEFDGKFFNVPEPYIKHLKDFKAKAKADLPNLVNLYRGRIPRSTIETLRQAETLKFFGNKEATFIPKITYRSKRDWSNVPEGLEAL